MVSFEEEYRGNTMRTLNQVLADKESADGKCWTGTIPFFNIWSIGIQLAIEETGLPQSFGIHDRRREALAYPGSSVSRKKKPHNSQNSNTKPKDIGNETQSRSLC